MWPTSRAPKDRAKAFGWMGSAFSFGFLVGPVFGGFLAGESCTATSATSPAVPFLVAAGLTAINWFYGLLVLPESLPPERRHHQVQLGARQSAGFAAPSCARTRELLGLATVGFLFQLAHTVLPSIFVLYAGFRYHWCSTCWA